MILSSLLTKNEHVLNFPYPTSRSSTLPESNRASEFVFMVFMFCSVY